MIISKYEIPSRFYNVTSEDFIVNLKNVSDIPKEKERVTEPYMQQEQIFVKISYIYIDIFIPYKYIYLIITL